MVVREEPVVRGGSLGGWVASIVTACIGCLGALCFWDNLIRPFG